MADTIFSNWLSALKDLQSSVSKDLSEIRRQKAEIQQLKADILNEVARGRFIRDNERLVLSAPEIVIGNVDASGLLYGDGGTIVIRGQKLAMEGVGEHGSIETRAPLIAQTAVDPGPDGIEEVVRSQSAIVSQARHITLQSNEAQTDGYFSRPATTAGASGVRIHADEQIDIDASKSVKGRKEAIENSLDAVKQEAQNLNSDAMTAMMNVTGIVAKMELLLKGQDLLEGDEMTMRAGMTQLDELTQQFKDQLPQAYGALESTIATLSRLAETKRRQKALEAEKKAVEEISDDFEKQATGASLNVTAEQMRFVSKDGDNNIRENPDAGISVEAGRVDITTYKKDGSLIDDSRVHIATHDVEISTVNPKLKEEGKRDGDYLSEGSVRINSKDVSIAAIDYSVDGGKYEVKGQTKDSWFGVYAENMSMMSIDNDGNTTGSLNVAAENLALSARDKDGKASGQLVANAKNIFVRSMDTDKAGKEDKGLAEGGNMVILAEKMFVGRTNDDTLTKELQISADKTGIYGKTTAEMQQDGGKALLQLDGGNIALKGSKLEYYGDNTVNGKTEFKADVKAPKLVADNLEAKSSFKSSNISDGIAVPGAPSSAKLDAKLKENDAPEKVKSEE